MKSITVKLANGQTKVFATNKTGEGLFSRAVNAGAYSQISGNSQFKANKTAKGFFNQVQRELEIKGELTDSMGW
jgi:hypothetical protein